MLYFCRHTGMEAFLRRYRELWFVDPRGRSYRLSGCPLLPAPLHLAPSFFRLGFLGWQDRLRVLVGLARLMQDRQPPEQMSFGQWLSAQGQTPLAVERFWTPVVLSALAELPDRVAFPVARKVFVEGLLASPDAYQLLRPTLPWGQLLEEYLGQWLADRGVLIHRKTPVRRIQAEGREVRALVLRDGSVKRFDFYLLAVSWRQAAGLVCPAIREAIPQLAQAAHWPTGAITTWHVWFDRPITPLPQTTILGKGIQWLFAGFESPIGRQEPFASSSPQGPAWAYSKGDTDILIIHGQNLLKAGPSGYCSAKPPANTIFRPLQTGAQSHYYQVVLSATHALPAASVPQTIQNLLQELREVFPAAKDAQMQAFRQVKMSEAVFSPQPVVENSRPGQKTALKNLVLAGDWTATGWPATMESAVRSGYQAAQVVLDQLRMR